jgi:hypothetical protein
MDRFEKELSESLMRRPAPPGLKGRILAERARRAAAKHNDRHVMWMRLAASVVIAAVLAGAGSWQWRRVEERRRGEEARQQVMTALGITAKALDKVQRHLQANDGKED